MSFLNPNTSVTITKKSQVDIEKSHYFMPKIISKKDKKDHNDPF
jgi:hypothetical protein